MLKTLIIISLFFGFIGLIGYLINRHLKIIDTTIAKDLCVETCKLVWD